MAVFLAGVGNAQIFDGSSLIASAKTLVDSSITIGVTAEDIRAGMGATLYGKYFHTSTFDLKLTDAMFNLEYLAKNVGSDIIIGGDVFYDEQLTSSGAGVLTFSRTAVPMEANSSTIYVWAKLPSEDSYTMYISTNGTTITVPTTNAAYCVKYLYTNSAAQKIYVSGNYIPSTVTIYLTANLYAGDANNPSTGTKVGTVTIKVPRFLLNGTQDLTMNMTGASQTSFEGSALGYGAEGCDGQAIYAEIIEVLNNSRWFSEANGLIIEDSDITMTVAEATAWLAFSPSPTVYAWYPNAVPKMISNTILTAQESDIAAGSKSSLAYTITAGTTGLTINSTTGVFSGTPAAGTATVTVVASEGATPIPGMDAAMVITITT